VHRNFGQYDKGPRPSGAMAPIISMEELNEMLAIQRNHIVLGAGANAVSGLFHRVDAKSMFRSVVSTGKVIRKRIKHRVFDATGTVPDSQHPLHQFALDGLVATRVEDVDDLNTYSTAAAQNVCTVAVKGHAPMRLEHVPSEVGLFRRQSHDPAGNLYLQPVRILAKVLVVLVAVLVDEATQRWRLQYEVVSSSNLDVDQRFATGTKLYRTNLSHEPNTAVAGDRLALRVVQLGSIVDTRFGAADQRQLTVCVNIAVFEPTVVVMVGEPDKDDVSKTVNVPLRIPRAAFRAFDNTDNPKPGKSIGVGLGASTGLRRLQTGDRPSTGAGAAELEALRRSISDMNVIVQRLVSEVKGAKQAQQAALNDLDAKLSLQSDESNGRSDQLLAELKVAQQQQKQAASSLQESVRTNHDKLDTRIAEFLSAQFSRYDNAISVLIQTRIYEWINAIIRNETLAVLSDSDRQLKTFARDIVNEYELDHEDTDLDDENAATTAASEAADKIATLEQNLAKTNKRLAEEQKRTSDAEAELRATRRRASSARQQLPDAAKELERTKAASEKESRAKKLRDSARNQLSEAEKNALSDDLPLLSEADRDRPESARRERKGPATATTA